MTRARAIELAVVLACVALAFVAGRLSAPVQVDERVEYRTEYRTKTVEVVKWRTARAVDTTTTTRPVLLPVPDGGVLLGAITTTESRERVTTSAASDTATTATGSELGKVDRTARPPDWRVGVLVGASFVQPAVPITGPLVIGAQVDRRILGGFSAGVWVNTVGAAGVAASLEF